MLGQVQDAVQVLGDGAARGGAFGGVVAEHAGEFVVAVGAPGQVGHVLDGDAGEQALQHGVPPVVGVQVPGGVRADGGGEEPGVVGAQGVLDEREGVGAGHEVGQGVQDGAAFVGGALEVHPGQGVGAGPGRVQDEDPGGVGVRRHRSGGRPRRGAAPTTEMGPWMPGWAAASSRAWSSQARAAWSSWLVRWRGGR